MEVAHVANLPGSAMRGAPQYQSICPVCAVDTFRRYRYSFGLTLMLPLIPFSVSGIMIAVSWLWARTIAASAVYGVSFGFMCASAGDVRQYAMLWLARSVPFLHVIYNVICAKTFNTFSCFQLRDGPSVMVAAPEVVCWDGAEHRALVGVSILAVGIYVIGIPAYVFCLMRYAHRNDKLRDPEYLQVVGFIYVRYGTPRARCFASHL